MKRSIQALIASLLLIVGINVATQTPANAYYANCPSNRVCIWDGFSGSGQPIYAWIGAPGTCDTVPAAVKNRANSFYNRLNGIGRAVQFYDGDNCQGTLLRRQANGSGGPHFSGVQDNFYIDRLLDYTNRVNSIFFNTCNWSCG